MSKVRTAVYALAASAGLSLIVPAGAQQAHPGLELIKAKCAQCHTNAMWRDARQDARAWEAALYRMVGRGGVWTSDEIKQMADYLGTDFGPNSKPPEPSK